MKVLVTGGAGYIGSHIVRLLHDRGIGCIVLDDLSLGHAAAVQAVPLVRGDVGDRQRVGELLRDEQIDVVIHMAARSLVGESVGDPGLYYRENLSKGLNLLEAMRGAGCRRIVFSSTAAVYGEPLRTPIPEDHPAVPTNPYGATKLAFEEALRWYRRAYGLGFVSLRYFNAAGAAPEADLGEDHDPETHLIPLVLRAALGTGEVLRIHGTDYPTRDGTCVRDYIHVVDLAEAHVLAAERLAGKDVGVVYNLGTGEGTTVREIVTLAREITGRHIACRDGPRRPGDPAVLIASRERAEQELGWAARRPLRDILESAWAWHRARPNGYR